MKAILTEIIIGCSLLLIPASQGLLKQYTLDDFRRVLSKAKNVVVITGAGISAESGVPTYRATKGLWRNTSIEKLTTVSRFKVDPATVWEFYQYRREIVLQRKPNAAHFALAEFERGFKERGFNFTLITANEDGLHTRAGSQNVIELHGSLLQTRCTKCNHTEENLNRPLCPALQGKELLYHLPFQKSTIPKNQLPRCSLCGGLLRPNVAFYYDSLNETTTNKAWASLNNQDVGIVIGLSSYVLPIGLFGPNLVKKGCTVAEFNLRKGSYTDTFSYFFRGTATEMIPKVLDRDWELRKERRSSWLYSTTYDRSSLELNFSNSYYTNSVEERDRTFSVFDRKDYKNDVFGIHPSREEKITAEDFFVPSIKSSSSSSSSTFISSLSPSLHK